MKHVQQPAHRVLLIAGLAALLALAACGLADNTVVAGNGEVIERSIDLDGFEAVILNGIGTVNITTGSAHSVVLSAESNIADVLTHRVSDGRLILSVENNTSITPTRGITYTVTLPTLARLELDGAGDFNVDRVTGESLVIRTDGAGSVSIASIEVEQLEVRLIGVGSVTVQGGSVTRQTVRIDGVGGYNARAMTSDEADIVVAGAGSATITVTGTLSGSLDGVGSIRYAGDPATVNVEVNALGSLQAIDG